MGSFLSSAGIHGIFLWSVVVWPLLLLPVRGRWSLHLALVPAAVLLLVPGEVSMTLPWVVLGSGLAIDADTRWILVTCVTIWFVAAQLMVSSGLAKNTTSPFYLLTLTAQLGAVLAADVITFFSFSTFMVYAFYGVLIRCSEAAPRGAGRFYIVVFFVADLILFEALLLIASGTDDLRFESVRQVLTVGETSPFIIAMLLGAYALRAGVWPAHAWLLDGFASVSHATRVLLMGVPVAMALLGMVRLLPMGLSAFFALGTVFQLIGTAAALRALLRMGRGMSRTAFVAWFSIALTGCFIFVIGTGLAYPDRGGQYAHLLYPLSAVLGLVLAGLALVAKGGGYDPVDEQSRVFVTVMRSVFVKGLAFIDLLERLRERAAMFAGSAFQVRHWDRLADQLETQLRRWPLVMVLLLLFAVAAVVLASVV